MSRNTGPKCRLCRREGMKLFLKGSRCFTAKCAVERRESAPGMHTWRRGKPSGYHNQLREKQKVKRYYGTREAQFRRFFAVAERTVGNTGEALLVMLEKRLDNVLYLGGFALSRTGARQMITHGMVRVDGHRADVPSYIVSQDNVITVKGGEKAQKLVKENMELTQDRERPQWLQVDPTKPAITVLAAPTREDISVEAREQLVIEFLSK